ncbi:hypothetical protein HOF78_01720 [Candidatus Woesearchaeota archaeon]|jgi:hypothetical protein|nr:hypothetical protein [Candidatus Woesearchaeota archaeon]
MEETIELRAILRKTLVDAIPELDSDVDESFIPPITLNSLGFVIKYLDERDGSIQDALPIRHIHSAVVQGAKDITHAYPFVRKTPEKLSESERELYPSLIKARDGLKKAGRIIEGVFGNKYKA